MRINKKNVAILEETLDIFEKGSYEKGGKTVTLKLDKRQTEEAVVFLPDEVHQLSPHRFGGNSIDPIQCRYACINADSFVLARSRSATLHPGDKPVLVLNFANPVNIGGGVRRGSRAQEEELCRKSSLLISLESGPALKYYEYNRSLNTFMGSDGVIISPQVEIIRDEGNEFLDDTVVVAVMTCAAPKINFGLEGMSEEEYEDMFLQRIEGMLSVAASLGYRDLVLGAFGCGAFGNDAKVVSDLFRRALDEFNPTVFRRVDFAVLDRTDSKYNIKEFARNFRSF